MILLDTKYWVGIDSYNVWKPDPPTCWSYIELPNGAAMALAGWCMRHTNEYEARYAWKPEFHPISHIVVATSDHRMAMHIKIELG